MPTSFHFFKGRIALYAILQSIGIKQDDEVILPGFTCVVVPNAIVYLGGKPVYIDINPTTYNIDPQSIEDKITRRTKVIIAQHTFGIPAEMDKISEIAKKYNLYVIEDSCHAIGSKYKGKEVGTLGDAAFFSSQWSKPVTTGLGGWAVVNNPGLSEKVREAAAEFRHPTFMEGYLLRLQYFLFSSFVTPSLFWFAQSSYRKLSELGITVGSSSQDELQCRMPDGYAKKMSSWQRNVLEKKLDKIENEIGHRNMITSIYKEMLFKRGIETVNLPLHCEPVFLRYPLQVKDKRKVLDEAKKKHIELGDWFISPVHPNQAGWERSGYRKGTCPNAEAICSRIINLPTHQKIGEKEVEKIVEFIADNR